MCVRLVLGASAHARELRSKLAHRTHTAEARVATPRGQRRRSPFVDSAATSGMTLAVELLAHWLSSSSWRLALRGWGLRKVGSSERQATAKPQLHECQGPRQHLLFNCR